MCCVFTCTNSRHTLKTSLCCAFYCRKPCHDHTFDLLCFHMYKPQSNLNSRQRTKPTVAARKKLIELSFKILSHLLAHRFEVWTRFAWGLYIWKTSMPELYHLKCSCHCKLSVWLDAYSEFVRGSYIWKQSMLEYWQPTCFSLVFSRWVDAFLGCRKL